jgi:citrate lyase subunit beta/citryl-CoA lyase
MAIRPRRSVLYMPGSNLRALEKARTLPADALVLDLEDAVGPDKKSLAREQIVAAVKAGGYGKREVIVRVNALDTLWGKEDVIALAQSGADGLCLPKVETASQIHALLQLMDQSAAPDAMKVWAMIETPKGVISINEIVSASPRLTVIAMGTTDLAKELRVPHVPSRVGLITSLGQCVLAARAHNKEILDGVYLNLDDEAGFANACEQGRELGFDGKTLIHPKQLAAANTVFGPSEQELARARKIIEAWRQAEAEGSGVVVVDGSLVEGMHVDEAKRQLEIADVIAELSAL